MFINEKIIQEIENGCQIIHLIEFKTPNVQYYFNTSDLDLTFNGKLYSNGYDLIKAQFDNLENKSNLSIQLLDTYEQANIDIETLLSSSVIIRFATLDKGRIASTITIFSGFVDNMTKENNSIHISLLSNIAKLNKPITQLFSPICRECFGNSKCGVNIEAYKAQGTISKILSPSSFVGTHQENKKTTIGYYRYGTIKMKTGKLKDFSLQLRDEKENEVILLQNTNLLAVDDEYEIFAGCDKTTTTCKNKFNNIINFRGEPFINEN